MAEVLHPKHRHNAHLTGIYLNIFQPSHDRQLASMAKKMRSAGLMTDTFVNMKSVTVIVTNDANEKVPILNVSDLEPYAERRELGELDVSQEES